MDPIGEQSGGGEKMTTELSERVAGAPPPRSDHVRKRRDFPAWEDHSLPYGSRFRRLLSGDRDARCRASTAASSPASGRPASTAGRSARRRRRGARTSCFYPTAAAAQAAGFRPCLRCRPETSPARGAWHGTSNTVSRALMLIEGGALDEAAVDTLAARLGLGERHLRRLFHQHLGASPLAVAQTRRVLLARQLIDETDLPMTEVALAAGFGSLRRFNDTFRHLYGRPPSALRRRRGTAAVAAPGSASDARAAVPSALRLGGDARLPRSPRHSRRRADCR